MRERLSTANCKLAGIPAIYWGEYIDEIVPLNEEQESYKQKLIDVERGKWWSLVVLGTVGNGKTKLASGLVALHEYYHPFTSCYITAEKMADECKASYTDGSKISELSLIEKYQTCGLLVIDELTTRNWTDYTKNLIQKVIAGRYDSHKRTVLIGNLSAETFKGMLDEHILSRLREGDTQIMVAPDMRLHGEF